MLDLKDHYFACKPGILVVSEIEHPDCSALEPVIEVEWKSFLEMMAENGKTGTDGDLVGLPLEQCLALNSSQNGTQVDLDVFRTKYSQWYATKRKVPGCAIVSAGSAGLTFFEHEGERYFIFGEAGRNDIGGDLEFGSAGTLDHEDLDVKTDRIANAFESALHRETWEEHFHESSIPMGEVILQSSPMGILYATDYVQLTACYLTQTIPIPIERTAKKYAHDAVLLGCKPSAEHIRLLAIPERSLGSFAKTYGHRIGPRSAALLKEHLEGT